MVLEEEDDECNDVVAFSSLNMDDDDDAGLRNMFASFFCSLGIIIVPLVKRVKGRSQIDRRAFFTT